jgi:hypothetical protein
MSSVLSSFGKISSYKVKGLTEKSLIRFYIDNKWSCIRIAKHLGCNDETVRKALIRHNIPIRTKSEAGRIKKTTATERKRLKTHFAKLNLNKMGEGHPSWKGGRYIDSYGYVIRRINGRVIKEHRYVMEQHLKYKLKTWHEVHHINGIRTDNRLENLEVVVNEHKRKDWLRRNAQTAS